LLYQLNPAVNDANPDNDGDGMNNVGEYQAGTDPESSSSLLRATTLAPAPGGWSFGWQAVPGMTYAIETSADLTNWNSVGEVLADTSGEVVTIPAASGENCLFFRARVLR
jgi:hypothetical protein